MQSLLAIHHGNMECSRGFFHRTKNFRNKPVSFWYHHYSHSFFTVSAEIYDSQLSAMEVAVLNAMLTGSSVLNLRAHFLSQLPNLRGLAGMLTHLNLSFNQLWVGIKSLYCDLVMNIFTVLLFHPNIACIVNILKCQCLGFTVVWGPALYNYAIQIWNIDYIKLLLQGLTGTKYKQTKMEIVVLTPTFTLHIWFISAKAVVC